jgi:hypothetical protein
MSSTFFDMKQRQRHRAPRKMNPALHASHRVTMRSWLWLWLTAEASYDCGESTMDKMAIVMDKMVFPARKLDLVAGEIRMSFLTCHPKLRHSIVIFPSAAATKTGAFM